MRKIIESMIEKALEKELKEREIGIYYPSELPFCMRRNWYIFKKPKRYKTDTLRIFEAGNLVHGWFAELFKNSELIEESISEGIARESFDGFEIHGRFDNFLFLNLQGETAILEIKTVMNKRFIKEPKKHHIMQLMYYMSFFQLEEGFLLYVDRRDLSFKIFKIDYDKEVVERIIKRAKLLHGSLISDVVPSPEAKLDKAIKWMCNYCHYRQECAFEDVKESTIPEHSKT